VSLTKRILFGTAASGFSRMVQILLGLTLLPVLFRSLPKEELGLWLLLGQSWATLGILDFGFGVTLTRAVAFAKGKSGSDPKAPLTDATLAEIADLLCTGRRIYAALAVIAFCVPLFLGFYYLRSLSLDAADLYSVWLAWGVLCLGQALMVWATPWTSLLQGVGYVGWDALIASFVQSLMIAAQIVVVVLGGSLVSLAIVTAIGALSQRLALFAFARRNRPELFERVGRWQRSFFNEMRPLAFRAWLTALGVWMISSTDQFIIASLQGVPELPAYRAAWLLLSNVTILAVMLATSSGVFVSHLWQAGQVSEIHRIVKRNCRFGWLVMACTAVVLLMAGQSLFSVWLGSGNFVGYPLLIVFLLIFALDNQSVAISVAARATGEEIYAASSLMAGLLKIVLSVMLAKQFGLIGIALGTLIALGLTNHWYVPWRGLARLSYSRLGFVADVVIPSLGVGLLCAGTLAALMAMVDKPSRWLELGITFSWVGLFFLAGMWILVLEPQQKAKLALRLRHAFKK
jgi:O-antigen/teichoic acid export membrane protein